jgi:hypothetical protein
MGPTTRENLPTTAPQPPRPAGSSATHGHPMSPSVINFMSPNGAQSPDPEELRRAISPTGQQKLQANGISQGPFSSKEKGKNASDPGERTMIMAELIAQDKPGPFV